MFASERKQSTLFVYYAKPHPTFELTHIGYCQLGNAKAKLSGLTTVEVWKYMLTTKYVPGNTFDMGGSVQLDIKKQSNGPRLIFLSACFLKPSLFQSQVSLSWGKTIIRGGTGPEWVRHD